LDGKLRESLGDHFSDSGALVLTKEFVAELDNIISEGILDNFIDAESDFVDEFFFSIGCKFLDFFGRVVSLKFRDEFHHMFNDTHGVFV
jgi:hypothetical protein